LIDYYIRIGDLTLKGLRQAIRVGDCDFNWKRVRIGDLTLKGFILDSQSSWE